MNYASGSSSPPPLRHPVPTHPTSIPEPPVTPGSPDGYQRFSSSPQYAPQTVPAYPSYRPPPPPQFQQPQQPQAHVPNFSGWGVDDTTARLGFQLGNTAVQAGQDYVQKNLSGVVPLAGLKHRFDVSNMYVLNKLKLVVFPWKHKPWSRRILRSEQGTVEWYPPRDDLNSPDLYIPLMAIITYILLVAFHSGRPTVLGESASSAFAVVLVDFCFVYLGCYFLNIQGSGHALDIIAYSGYKFVGVIATILPGFFLERTLWKMLVFLYFFFAHAFFLLRSLRSLVLMDSNTSTSTISSASRKRRIMFLFLEAACQVLYMGALARV